VVHALVEPFTLGGGCGTNGNLNDFSSKASMEANGWSFSWTDLTTFIVRTPGYSTICTGLPASSYCGADTTPSGTSMEDDAAGAMEDDAAAFVPSQMEEDIDLNIGSSSPTSAPTVPTFSRYCILYGSMVECKGTEAFSFALGPKPERLLHCDSACGGATSAPTSAPSTPAAAGGGRRVGGRRGMTGMSEVGVTLTGSGSAVLDYGSVGGATGGGMAGSTSVYLNNAVIDTAQAGTPSKTVTFNFADGDTLQVRGASVDQGYSVIAINHIAFSCSNAAILDISGVDGAPLTLEVDVSAHHDVSLGLDASISLFHWTSIAAQVNISDSGWTVAFNGSALDSLLQLDFAFESIGPIQAPTDLSITASGSQGIFDWLSTQGVAHTQAIENAMLTQLASDKSTVDAWYATGGGHDALVALNTQIDRMESEMLEVLGSAQADLGKAMQTLTKAHKNAEAISTQISDQQASLQSCKWYDVPCNVQNAWVHTKIIALEAEQLLAEGAIDVAEAAVHALQASVSGATAITIQADLDAKYASQATYNASRLLVDTALDASQSLTATIGDMSQYIEHELGSAFNLRSLTLSGTYASATSSGTVSCRFSGVFFGTVMDHSFSLPFGQGTAATTASSILSEVYHMVENKWLNNSAGSAPLPPLPPPTPPSPATPSPAVFDRCNAFADCAACENAPRLDGTACGWCQLSDGSTGRAEGACVSGTAAGPATFQASSRRLATCSDWRYGTCDAPPPPPPAPPACPVGFNDNTCSNYGTCNTATWSCDCQTGRKGSACEFSCPDLSIPTPKKDGHGVSHCSAGNTGTTSNCFSDSSVGWVADKICQASSMGPNSVATHYENGHCDSGAKLSYWSGGTCETHWYNFGDCQCTPVVNVMCSNTAAGCT